MFHNRVVKHTLNVINMLQFASRTNIRHAGVIMVKARHSQGKPLPGSATPRVNLY